MRRDRLGDSFASVLSAAQAGGGWAFTRLWDGYAGTVTGYLRVQGVTDPEDVTSDVFLAAFRSIGTFEGDEAGFRSWLFTIAHRRVIDERRRLGRRPPPDALEEHASLPSEPDAEDVVIGRMATDRVRSLCDRLVPDQRDVLLLRLVGGFTVEEVGAALGKSSGAVKQLQRRGLLALRKILEREGVPL